MRDRTKVRLARWRVSRRQTSPASTAGRGLSCGDPPYALASRRNPREVAFPVRHQNLSCESHSQQERPVHSQPKSSTHLKEGRIADQRKQSGHDRSQANEHDESFRSCPSRASGLNLSIAQKQIAPTTSVMRMPIKREKHDNLLLVSCPDDRRRHRRRRFAFRLLSVQQPEKAYPGQDRRETANAACGAAQGKDETAAQG